MRIHQFVLSIVTLALSAVAAFAGGDTEFTYQGRLLVAGEPANGTFNVDFGLWDGPAGGNQVDVTNSFNSLPIVDGHFTVELDFGASAFDNNDRWLEITIDGVPLVPRQPITRAPYAIQTRGIFVDESGQVGIGTNTPLYTLHIESNGFTGIYTSGTNYGVFAQSNSTSGAGVRGSATAFSGATYGGYFTSDSTSYARGLAGKLRRIRS